MRIIDVEAAQTDLDALIDPLPDDELKVWSSSRRASSASPRLCVRLLLQFPGFPPAIA